MSSDEPSWIVPRMGYLTWIRARCSTSSVLSSEEYEVSLPAQIHAPALYGFPLSLLHASSGLLSRPVARAPGAIYAPHIKEKRTNAREPCTTLILASTAGYYGCEEGYFQCIDPSAACVDDDDVTAEMVENCGWVWNIGTTGSALLFFSIDSAQEVHDRLLYQLLFSIGVDRHRVYYV